MSEVTQYSRETRQQATRKGIWLVSFTHNGCNSACSALKQNLWTYKIGAICA